MRKKCYWCLKKIDHADFRDGAMLSRYLTAWGQIKTRKETGLCAKHQRRLAKSMKRARSMAVIAAVPNIK